MRPFHVHEHHSGGAVGVQRVLADDAWEWLQKGGKPLMRGRTAGGELDNILYHGMADKVGVYFCGKEQLCK